METYPEKKYLLAIETAAQRGSISVFEGRRMIAFSLGDKKTATSVNILEKIEGVLHTNNLKKSDLGAIAVSKGPGSLTGVRVGKSFAKGLSDSLGARLRTVSLLDALVWEAEGAEDNILAMVYVGRNEICQQFFYAQARNNKRELEPEGGSEISKAEISKMDEFEMKMLQTMEKIPFKIILTRETFEKLNSFQYLKNDQVKDRIFVARENLAELVGYQALSEKG